MILLSVLHACASREAVRPAPEKPVRGPESGERIDVISCRLAPDNEFVEVRFRRFGAAELDPGQGSTYLLDESTGKKFYLMRLQRIGRLAEIRNPEEGSVHSFIFRDIEKTLRFGSKVTLVVGSTRKEHLVLGK